MRTYGIAWCLLLATTAGLAQKVSRAYVGQDGQVHITLEGKPEFVAPREVRTEKQRMGDSEDRQATVESPVVASDKRTVAWIVNFPNCCTSYPIPLTLIVFRNGKIVHRFSDRPIFKFEFQAGGRQIAYVMASLHGQPDGHCVLRDTVTGKVLEEWFDWKGTPLPAWAGSFSDYVDVPKDQ